MEYKLKIITTSTVCHIKTKLISYRSYANLNKWVFIKPMKLSTVLVCLISRGSSFHNLGAYVVNALSQYFLVLAFGCFNLCCWLKRKYLVGTYGWSRSAKNTAALSWWDLNTSKSILYWMWYLTGKQWSDMRVGEMWSDFLFWVINLAALFSISCNLPMRWSAMPYKRELLLSSLEIMDVCTSFSTACLVKHLWILDMAHRWR